MDFKSLPELLDYFKEEKTCKEYYAQVRWGGKPICPFCGHDKVYITNRGYKCAKCLKKFSVTVGSIFEQSHIPLRLWFAALYLGTAHKKGISSVQLGKDLGVPQKTAWFMWHRLREMFKETNPALLTGTVQIDETYVGGKYKNKHKDKKGRKGRGRSFSDKTPVVGLLENGETVRAFVVTNTESKVLTGLVRENVDNKALVVIDSYKAYGGVKKEFKHVVVKHSGAEHYFLVDKKYHTQNIENFWSHFKRGIIGVYHNISKKHLQRYCEEFSLRYNTRGLTDSQRFNETLTKGSGKRLKYKTLTYEKPKKKPWWQKLREVKPE